MSPKGQITLPIEIRRELGINPKDRVEIELVDGVATVRRKESKLLKWYQSAGKLERPMEWSEVTRVVWDEVAVNAAREGLDE